MTIALASRRRFDGARYQITGEISRNAAWSQTLDFPADGASVVLTGLVVYLTFRELDSETAAVTLSTTSGDLTVSDADTLTISVAVGDLTALTEGLYIVDITSGTTVTHWASGKVAVRDNPSI